MVRIPHFMRLLVLADLGIALHSLQGALGKTSGRSYKAAPRQLLQVDAGNAPSPTLSHATATAHISKNSSLHEGAAKEAAKLGREALGVAADVRLNHDGGCAIALTDMMDFFAD